MSADSSKTPQTSETESRTQQIDPLAMRLLMVGDFTREGRGVGAEGPVRTFKVDKENFDELLGQMAPHVVFEVTNTLLGSKGELLADLEFKTLADFSSSSVVERIPALATLKKLHGNIIARSNAATTAEELAGTIEKLSMGADLFDDLIRTVRRSSAGPSSSSAPPDAPPSQSDGRRPPSPSESGVESILDMVDTGEPQRPAQSGSVEKAVKSAISSITQSGPSTAKGAEPAAGLLAPVHQWFQELIGRQLDLILHHPDFQSLESAWRGLRLLIERTDFRSGAVVEILPARKQDLRKVLVEGVLKREAEFPEDPPLTATLCDIDFENTPPDLDLLNEIAQACEMVSAPLVAQVGAQFFGRASMGELPAGTALARVLGGGPFAKWRGLRAKDEARWLYLTVNRLLLRRPWEARAGETAYGESCDETGGQGLLWGGAVWALAACMTRSFAEHDWPCFISGRREGGAIADLPLRSFEASGAKAMQIPVEVPLSDTQVQDLAAGGFMPMQTSANTDEAFFTYVPSVCAPKRYPDPKATSEAAIHAILPYQLFAGRTSQHLNRFLATVSRGGDRKEFETKLQTRLEAIFGGAGSAPNGSRVRAEVSECDDEPALSQVCIEIVPKFKFFGQFPRLLLEFRMQV